MGEDKQKEKEKVKTKSNTKVKHKPGEYLLGHQSNYDSCYDRKDKDLKRWPGKFKEEYCQDIVEFMGSGKSLAQWATKHKINPLTIKNWAHKYPQFLRARDEAIQAHMAYWEHIGEAGTVGKIPGFRDSTYRFMMKNRFPHVYKDVHHTEQTTTIKFETFVNEHGQIEQTRQDLLEGEIVEETEQNESRKTLENKGDSSH